MRRQSSISFEACSVNGRLEHVELIAKPDCSKVDSTSLVTPDFFICRRLRKTAYSG